MVIADGTIHAQVIVRAAVVVIGSPHHGEQREDDGPEHVDRVPVGGPGFNHEHSATSRVARFARHDAQDQQAQMKSLLLEMVRPCAFRRLFVGFEHDEHHPVQPTKVGQPERAGMVLDPSPGCDSDVLRSHSLTAGTWCRRDCRTVSFPYGGTHVFTPSMGGCEFERRSGTPATDRFALNARDQRVRVLDSLPKFSSR